MKWLIAQLGSVATIRRGASPRPKGDPRYFGGEIPWLKISDVVKGSRYVDKTKEYVTEAGRDRSVYVPAGELLLSNSASVGRPVINNIGVCIHDGWLSFSEYRKSLIRDFLYWYFIKSEKELIALAPSGTQANLNTALLKGFKVPIPALSEQLRIVELLDQADSLRRKRVDADDLAARILPSLFLKMFGDPATNPKGWKKSSLGEISSLVTSGLTPRGGEANYTTTGPIFLRSQNIQMNRLHLGEVACLPEEVHSSMQRTHVRLGDVLLNITGASIGRVAWYDLKDQAANVNQHVCIIRLKEVATPEYVSVFLSMPYGQILINSAQTGATRQGLNHESVRRISLPLPPIAKQQAFVSFLSKLRQNSEQQCASSLKIETLFQTMLHRAFTGELTAGWRQAHMKELLAEMELQSKAIGKLEEAA